MYYSIIHNPGLLITLLQSKTTNTSYFSSNLVFSLLHIIRKTI